MEKATSYKEGCYTTEHIPCAAICSWWATISALVSFGFTSDFADFILSISSW